MERFPEAHALGSETLSEIVRGMDEMQAKVALLTVLGCTQEQAAEALGCDQATVSRSLAGLRNLAVECMA